MRQSQCVEFLKWALPRLGLSWPGFVHVHRQVCKRLGNRVTELGLADFDAYRAYVETHDTEWATIEASCHITISRFFRDAEVFDYLAHELMPRLAAEAQARGAQVVRAWSAGCGAGEEPYSLTLAWRFVVAPRFPGLPFVVVATDIDEGQLTRARIGCYRPSSLREVPESWRAAAFEGRGVLRCLQPTFRENVAFMRQDLRADAPKGPFDLVLCRNLAFTYFDAAQRRHVLAVLLRELAPGGALVIGWRERLPKDASGLAAWAPDLKIYRKPLARSHDMNLAQDRVLHRIDAVLR
jgi:chemotaxis protein methyltransferase CheR